MPQRPSRVTQTILRARPGLVTETLRDAKIIGEALDGVWTHLDRIVQGTRTKISPIKVRPYRRSAVTSSAA